MYSIPYLGALEGKLLNCKNENEHRVFTVDFIGHIESALSLSRNLIGITLDNFLNRSHNQALEVLTPILKHKELLVEDVLFFDCLV
jgi:hypothetical protein